MQTAVEWLDEQLQDTMFIQYGYVNGVRKVVIPLEDYMKFKQQAKEMEKQQIIDAYNEGYGTRDAFGDVTENNTGEQYYTETYGSKGNDECREINWGGVIQKMPIETFSQTKYEQINQDNPITRGSTALVTVSKPIFSKTEISDEEIEKGAREWYDKERPYKPSVIALKTWVSACKWYKEQLKSKL